MSGLSLAKLFLAELLALNTWKLFKSKHRPADFCKRPHPTPIWMRLGFYAVLAVLLTATQTWGIFLLYWVIPILTVLQAIVRWGAICEHQYNLPNASIAKSSPIILPRWWENLLLPNLNFTLHPYHHYFPGASFSFLPKVHAIFCREGLIDDSRVFHGYGAYLKYLIGQPSFPQTLTTAT